jgi:hypothetical protein
VKYTELRSAANLDRGRLREDAPIEHADWKKGRLYTIAFALSWARANFRHPGRHVGLDR